MRSNFRLGRPLNGLICAAVIMCSSAVCQDLPLSAGDPQIEQRDARESFTQYGVLLYSVDVKFPHLKYPTSDDPVQENVNQVNAGVFDQWVNPYGMISKFTSDMILGKGAKGPSSLTGTYSAEILKNGFISVLSVYAFHRPGVDPEYRISTVNYCHRHQKIYWLGEIFRPDLRDYQSQLSPLAINSLKQQGYADPLALWRDPHRPTLLSLKEYVLTDTDLVLIFPNQRIKGDSGAPIRVVIPLDTLKALLRAPICD